ncbi:MAG: hypothetical protein FWG63_05175 [Defluviitaleaceae bacterium]|nr:hypothetical protein [Defluviitaleaceae bacterium]
MLYTPPPQQHQEPHPTERAQVQHVDASHARTPESLVANISPNHVISNPEEIEQNTPSFGERAGALGENIRDMGEAHADGKKQADETKENVENANLAKPLPYADRPPEEEATQQTDSTQTPTYKNDFDTSQSADNAQDQDYNYGAGF